MHLKEDDLYNLASAEYNSKILTDMQARQKWHLSECKECYKKFCIYITMLDLTGYEESSEDEEGNFSDIQPSDVFLQIYLAGAVISSVQAKMDNSSDYWNFIHIPQMSAARGSSEKTDIYKSIESEYSQICQKEQQIIIQLDGDIFPISQLRVRYKQKGKDIIKKFIYNETSQCYEVVIDRSGRDDKLLVDIISLNT